MRPSTHGSGGKTGTMIPSDSFSNRMTGYGFTFLAKSVSMCHPGQNAMSWSVPLTNAVPRSTRRMRIFETNVLPEPGPVRNWPLKTTDPSAFRPCTESLVATAICVACWTISFNGIGSTLVAHDDGITAIKIIANMLRTPAIPTRPVILFIFNVDAFKHTRPCHKFPFVLNVGSWPAPAYELI
jgi:hypothetical protein